jgi:hypothetical protein
MTIELTTGWLVGLFLAASFCSFIVGIILGFLWIARDGTYQKVNLSQTIIDKKALEEFIKKADTQKTRKRFESAIPEAGSYVSEEG